MNERSIERERVEEIDPEVVLFGFLSADLILTLLMVLPFVVFGGYTIAVDVPPLIPTVVSFVTGLFGAGLVSIRWTASRVGSAIEGTDQPKIEGMVVFLSLIFGVPTLIIGEILLLAFSFSLFFVFHRPGTGLVTAFLGVEGIIALALGYLGGLRVAVEMFVANTGAIPDGLSGRFWTARSAALTADLTTDPRKEEFDP